MFVCVCGTVVSTGPSATDSTESEIQEWRVRPSHSLCAVRDLHGSSHSFILLKTTPPHKNPSCPPTVTPAGDPAED